MAEQHLDFYQNLREKFRKWIESDEAKNNKYAEYLLFAPDLFHLMCKLTVDPDVSIHDKAKLAIAIAYFVSPIDLIPEAIVGPIGYVDDIALAAFVLNSIIKNNPEIVQKHWAGDDNVLEVIKKILVAANEMVGSGLWRKLKKLF